MTRTPQTFAIQHLLGKIKNRPFYQKLDKVDVTFQSSTCTYYPEYLVHSHEMSNLVFFCLDESRSTYYEIFSLNFYSEDKRNEAIEYVSSIHKTNIFGLRPIKEFYTEQKGPLYRLLIVEPYLERISLSNLIASTKYFSSLKDVLRTPIFKYNAIGTIWSVFKNMRRSGLKNLGIDSKLIAFINTMKSQITTSNKEIYLNFVMNPVCQVDYKILELRKKLIERPGQDVNMKDLINLQFFSEHQVARFENASELISDHNNFVIILLELVLDMDQSQFLSNVDFNSCHLSTILIDQIDDPFILRIIEDCLKDKIIKTETFFSNDYYELLFLEKSVQKKFEEIDLIEIPLSHFKIVLESINTNSLLEFLLSAELENIGDKKEELVAKILVGKELLRQANSAFRSPLTGKFASLAIFREVIYYIMVYIGIEDSAVESLDSPELRQFILLGMRSYALHHDNVSEPEMREMAKFLSSMFKLLPLSVYQFVNSVIKRDSAIHHFFKYVQMNSIRMEGFNIPVSYM